MNWAAITAIGTVLAGLALQLAFFQLGALRQDRLRGQISRVGAWAGELVEVPGKPEGRPGAMPVFVRNSSELPVFVQALVLGGRPGRAITSGGAEAAGAFAYVDWANVIDAAGYSWIMRPASPGPPRRIAGTGLPARPLSHKFTRWIS